MNTYSIEIKELLSRIIEVKANSLDEAISMVKDRYKKEEIILDSKDFVDTEIQRIAVESPKP